MRPGGWVELMQALRFVLLVMALTLIGSLGWRVIHPAVRGSATIVAPRQPVTASPVGPPAAPTQPTLPDSAQARGIVLSRLADAPDYVPYFDRLRTAFPADYLALVDQAVLGVTKTGHAPNPDRLMIDAVRSLRQNRGILASQAADAPLASIFVAELAMLDAMAADDPGLCVDFLYGGMSPNFMAFAAKHRELVERLAMSNLSAVASGQADHVERDQPDPGDFDALTTTLKTQGLSEDEISAVLDGKVFDPPLPEGRLCTAGQVYLRALQNLPDAVKIRIYALSAALLARS